jgi:hypothetical protein
MHRVSRSRCCILSGDPIGITVLRTLAFPVQKITLWCNIAKHLLKTTKNELALLLNQQLILSVVEPFIKGGTIIQIRSPMRSLRCHAGFATRPTAPGFWGTIQASASDFHIRNRG